MIENDEIQMLDLGRDFMHVQGRPPWLQGQKSGFVPKGKGSMMGVDVAIDDIEGGWRIALKRQNTGPGAEGVICHACRPGEGAPVMAQLRRDRRALGLAWAEGRWQPTLPTWMTISMLPEMLRFDRAFMDNWHPVLWCVLFALHDHDRGVEAGRPRDVRHRPPPPTAGRPRWLDRVSFPDGACRKAVEFDVMAVPLAPDKRGVRPFVRHRLVFAECRAERRLLEEAADALQAAGPAGRQTFDAVLDRMTCMPSRLPEDDWPISVSPPIRLGPVEMVIALLPCEAPLAALNRGRYACWSFRNDITAQVHIDMSIKRFYHEPGGAIERLEAGLRLQRETCRTTEPTMKRA